MEQYATLYKALEAFPYNSEPEEENTKEGLKDYFPSFISDVYRVLDVIVSSTELRGAKLHHVSLSIDVSLIPSAWVVVAYSTGAIILLAKPKIALRDVDLVVDKSDEIASAVEENYEIIPAVAGYVIDYDAEKYAKSIDVPVFSLDL